MILHWLGDMFDPLLTGYWGEQDLDAAADVVLDIIAANRRQGRRDQGLAAGRLTRGRAAAPAARGRAHVHRRRLQLPGADPRRGRGLQPRAARHLRRDRAGGRRRDARARRRRPRPLRRAARADGPALAPHLRRAHAVLQDGRRLPRLPQRPSAALPDGRRAGERALGPASRRAVRARRSGRPAARPGARERAHARRARRAWREPAKRSRSDPRCAGSARALQLQLDDGRPLVAARGDRRVRRVRRRVDRAVAAQGGRDRRGGDGEADRRRRAEGLEPVSRRLLPGVERRGPAQGRRRQPARGRGGRAARHRRARARLRPAGQP